MVKILCFLCDVFFFFFFFFFWQLCFSHFKQEQIRTVACSQTFNQVQGTSILDAFINVYCR